MDHSHVCPGSGQLAVLFIAPSETPGYLSAHCERCPQRALLTTGARLMQHTVECPTPGLECGRSWQYRQAIVALKRYYAALGGPGCQRPLVCE